MFGKGRCGVRVSPTGRVNDMYDSDPLATYSTLFKHLQEKQIGFIEIKEAAENDGAGMFEQKMKPHEQMKDCCKALRPFFHGTIINNDGLTQKTGLEKIKAGLCEVVSFGRFAISSPDLPERFRQGVDPNPVDFKMLFYGDGTGKGFTDYPTIPPLK